MHLACAGAHGRIGRMGAWVQASERVGAWAQAGVHAGGLAGAAQVGPVAVDRPRLGGWVPE